MEDQNGAAQTVVVKLSYATALTLLEQGLKVKRCDASLVNVATELRLSYTVSF